MEGSLSRKWIAASFGVFIAAEVVIGVLIGRPLVRGFVSHATALKIDLLLILASYFSGGWIVGFVSPTERIWEPAVGAAMAVGCTWLVGLFTPMCFFGSAMGRALAGAGVAFCLALAGAKLGEKAAARFGDRASRDRGAS